MKTPHSLLLTVLFAVLAAALPIAVDAGTVNLDLQPAAGVTAIAPGALGTGGHWNPITMATFDYDNVDDDQGNATTVDVELVIYDPFTTSDAGPGPSGNDIQRDHIYNNAPVGPRLGVEFSNLRPGEVYKVVVYCGTSADQDVTVEGPLMKTITGEVFGPLPGTEGADYALFAEVTAGSDGKLAAEIAPATGGSTAYLAGVQIQGWFRNEPKPWKADLSVSRKSTRNYKGNDSYAPRPTRGQTLFRRNRRGKFFFRLENDGTAFGEFFLDGTRNDREAKRRYFSLRPTKNISARVYRGVYSTELCAGDFQLYKAVIKAKRSARGTVDADLEATPKRNPRNNKVDVITAGLRP